MSFIKKAQVRGEVRQDLRPEFFLTVVQKMLELGRDEELIRLGELIKIYPNYSELIRLGELIIEINKFLYYGILPQPESEQK